MILNPFRSRLYYKRIENKRSGEIYERLRVNVILDEVRGSFGARPYTLTSLVSDTSRRDRGMVYRV